MTVSRVKHRVSRMLAGDFNPILDFDSVHARNLPKPKQVPVHQGHYILILIYYSLDKEIELFVENFREPIPLHRKIYLAFS